MYGCRGIGGLQSPKHLQRSKHLQRLLGGTLIREANHPDEPRSNGGDLAGSLQKTPTNPHIPAMMMLADADAQAWAIGPPLQGKVIQTANVTYNGKPATAQLMPRSQMGSVTTPWAPNVYRGTGEEERQTITFEITHSTSNSSDSKTRASRRRGG